MIRTFLLIFIILFLYLLLEFLTLNKSVKKIPIRILINGTRGKTTTVQIIYNILKQSGLNSVAKTTGEQPVEYNIDGRRKIIKRLAPASIIENVNLLRKWAKMNPEAAVLECMALHPENQFVLSKKMFKPTHIIVTNIYHDHFEVMGESINQISETISESYYRDAKIFFPVKNKSLIKQENEFVCYENKIFSKNYNNIPQTIINESWGLILKLCNDLQIDYLIAEKEFHEIWKIKNEKIKYENKKQQFEFWNLFSLNDYESAKKFIEFILDLNNGNNKYEILFNTRIDRPLRTKLFTSLISTYFKYCTIYVTGSGKSLAYKLLVRAGCTSAIKKNTSGIGNYFKNRFESFTIVVGLGNYKGMELFLENLNTGDRS